MNRPARFTVADLRRAQKVADEAGADWAVEIDPDGKIRIVRLREKPITASEPVEPDEDIVL